MANINRGREGQHAVAEAYLRAVAADATTARALSVTFQLLQVYLFIVVAGTTDEQLLRNGTVAVPTLSNAVVPADAFYAVMPYVFVFLHLQLLLHLGQLAHKLLFFSQAVEILPREGERRNLRLQLPSFPFANWLGSDPTAASTLRPLQWLLVWSTLVALPVVLLCYMQVRFLPYHSVGITWGHRVALLLDLVLVATFWPRFLRTRRGISALEAESVSRETSDDSSRLIALITRRLRISTPTSEGRHGDKTRDRFSGLVTRLIAAVGAIFRRVWIPAVTPLAVLATFLSTLIFTIPDEAIDHVARHILGDVIADSDMYFHKDPQSGFYKVVVRRVGLADVYSKLANNTVAQHVSPWTLVEAFNGHTEDRTRTTSCMRTLARFVPWGPADLSLSREVIVLQTPGSHGVLPSAYVGINLPAGLSANCLTVAFFHLHGSPFHRSLSVKDTVLASQTLRPEVVKNIRDTLRSSAEDAPKSRVVDEMGEFRDATFEVVGLNLSERDLRYADFSGSSFPRADLSRAHLEYSILAKADLREVQLESAQLHRSKLSGTDLEQSDLEGTDLTDADLEGSNLKGARLDNSTLDNAFVDQADFSGATMRWCSLAWVIGGARFRGADMTSADLRGASLRSADLTGANLDSAVLGGTNLSRASLSGMEVTGATLPGVRTSGATISGWVDFGVLPNVRSLSHKDLEGIPKAQDELGADLEGEFADDYLKELPFARCAQTAECKERVASLQQNARDYVEVLRRLACPGPGAVSIPMVRNMTFRIVFARDVEQFEYLDKPGADSRVQRKAVKSAADAALLDLTRGPCARFVPKAPYSAWSEFSSEH